MAIPHLEVAWRKDYDLGIGVDASSGAPMNQVVIPDASSVLDAKGAVVDMVVQRIYSTEELNESLDIGAEASYGCGAFGSGISARFKFSEESKVQTSSLFMVISVHVALNHLSIDAPTLTPLAAAEVDNQKLFKQKYGDMFIRGLSRGGVFVGVLRIDTVSQEQASEVAASIEGSYGLLSAKADAKFKSVQEKYKSEVLIRMYHEGGPVDLGINDLHNPYELLVNANRFLASFKEQPENVAIPYLVSLAPVTIAHGPEPLNEAQLESAQEVLRYCARKRSKILDAINLLEFMNENRKKFDVSNGASWDDLVTAIGNYQADYQIIVDCASAAMNHPASAKLPAPFAEDKGEKFPLGVLPDPLPVGIEVPNSAEVPDFRICGSMDACRALATKVGFYVDYHVEGEQVQEFKVIDVYPPIGSIQPLGSRVTITRPYMNYDLMVHALRVGHYQHQGVVLPGH